MGAPLKIRAEIDDRPDYVPNEIAAEAKSNQCEKTGASEQVNLARLMNSAYANKVTKSGEVPEGGTVPIPHPGKWPWRTS